MSTNFILHIFFLFSFEIFVCVCVRFFFSSVNFGNEDWLSIVMTTTTTTKLRCKSYVNHRKPSVSFIHWIERRVRVCLRSQRFCFPFVVLSAFYWSSSQHRTSQSNIHVQNHKQPEGVSIFIIIDPPNM